MRLYDTHVLADLMRVFPHASVPFSASDMLLRRYFRFGLEKLLDDIRQAGRHAAPPRLPKPAALERQLRRLVAGVNDGRPLRDVAVEVESMAAGRRYGGWLRYLDGGPDSGRANPLRMVTLTLRDRGPESALGVLASVRGHRIEAALERYWFMRAPGGRLEMVSADLRLQGHPGLNEAMERGLGTYFQSLQKLGREAGQFPATV